MQRRTRTKDYCPGKLDACCGGVLLAGEEYLPSAYRELAEEMGIEGVPLTGHGEFYWGDEQCKVWGGLFSCRYHGPLQLQDRITSYNVCYTKLLRTPTLSKACWPVRPAEPARKPPMGGYQMTQGGSNPALCVFGGQRSPLSS